MSRFLNGLQAEWKKMTTAEKIKRVLEIMTDIGGGAIGGTIAGSAAQGKNRLEKVCLCVTGVGLGMAVGEAARTPLNGLVDMVDGAVKERNSAKEGTPNA